MEKYVSDVFDSMETDEHLFLHTRLIKSNTFYAIHCSGEGLKRLSLNETSFSERFLVFNLIQWINVLTQHYVLNSDDLGLNPGP